MLGLSSLVVAGLVWVEYLARIPRERVPRRPVVHVVGQGVAVALGAAALVGGDGRVGGAGGIVLAGFFVWVLGQAGMPRDTITVSVGHRMIPFTATRPDGTTFASDELAGQRVILKFFRGHW